MRRKRIFITILVACLSGSFLLAAKNAASQKVSDLVVTSTIKDYQDVTDNTGVPQRLWMQIRSDGADGYKNSKSVQSIIQGTAGDWVLDTNYATSSTRSIFLDFSKPISGSGTNGGAPAPPFTAALVKARIISKCHEAGNSMFTMASGQTVTCPLVAAFFVGSSFYRIHMTPHGDVYPYPETDHATITCTGTNPSFKCNQWRVEPNGINGGCLTVDCSVRQNVVKLAKVVTVKGKETEVNQGDFYMAFSITITNP